jgi:hypothetical protein
MPSELLSHYNSVHDIMTANFGKHWRNLPVAIKSRGLYKAEVLSLYDNVINKMQIVKTRHCLSSLEFWRTIVSEWEPPNI